MEARLKSHQMLILSNTKKLIEFIILKKLFTLKEMMVTFGHHKIIDTHFNEYDGD